MNHYTARYWQSMRVWFIETDSPAPQMVTVVKTRREVDLWRRDHHARVKVVKHDPVR